MRKIMLKGLKRTPEEEKRYEELKFEKEYLDKAAIYQSHMSKLRINI
jgi:hypothetical protein